LDALTIYTELIHHLTMMVVLSLSYGLIIKRFQKSTFGRDLLLGCAFGLCVVIGMADPYKVTSGIIIDAESILISLAGLLVGPVAAISAAIIGIAFCLYLAGPGVVASICIIIFYALAGIAFRYHLQRKDRPITLSVLLVLGFSIHIGSLPFFFLLPQPLVWPVLEKITGPFLTIFPAATVLVGLAFLFFESQALTEKTLRESELRFKALYQEFQTILHGIPDRITLWDENLRPVWSNHEPDQDSPVDNTVTDHCFSLQVKDFEPCEDCALKDSFTNQSAHEREIKHADETFSIKYFPLVNDDNQVTRVITLAGDITEKKRLEKEALQSGRLAALGQLSAGIAHEINNPNALIVHNSGILNEIFPAILPILDDWFEQHGEFTLGRMPYSRIREELPRLANEISLSSHRIKSIVEDLKQFVLNAHNEKEESVDLHQVAAQAIHLVQKTAGGNTCVFQEHDAEALPPVKGDFRQLEQVVVNLLVNAIQSTSDNRKKISIKVWHNTDSGMNVIAVSDQGTGITEENLARITEPFFTTKRDQGGTGLGLSICTRIVKDHDGTLDISSVPGQGTIAQVLLPAHHAGDTHE